MKLLLISSIILCLILQTVYAQTNENSRRNNPFSGTINISVEGGATYSLSDYSDSKIDYIGRTSLEYFFPSNTISTLGLRLFGGGGYISGKDQNKTPDFFRTEMYFIGGGLIYSLAFSNYVIPYFFAGVSAINFNPLGSDGKKLPNNVTENYKKSELNYNVELGFRFKTTDNLSINISGGIQLSTNDNLDDIMIGSTKDMFLISTLGLTYSMLGYHDSDNDGVEDLKDMCTGTPIGVKVDEFGCPVDSDKDGVADYLDRCLGTPEGIKVDKEGCSLDTDEDGVFDYADICPGTPRSVVVDKFGCPFDYDGDGIPDYLDACPNTKEGTSVNEKGCPVDSDLDGIPDYLDQCPDSNPGAIVDEQGCNKKVGKNEELNQEFTLQAGTTFEFGKTELLPAAYPALNRLLIQMRKIPNSRWQIAGYTDNIGSDNINYKISFVRAESVVEYFYSNGITKTRFEIIGMGEENPVADNNTEEGRSLNRRVVITRVK